MREVEEYLNFTCDRCNKKERRPVKPKIEYTKIYHRVGRCKIEAKSFDFKGDLQGPYETSYELCDECLKGLEKWIQNL